MVLGLLVAMVCVFYTRAQADVKLIVALTGFMQNHCRRANHARDQKAQHDVIGKMHGVVPAMLKVACTRAVNVTEQRDRSPLPAAKLRLLIVASRNRSAASWCKTLSCPFLAVCTAILAQSLRGFAS